MKLKSQDRERLIRADEEAPWDGWELWVSDNDTGQFICVARNCVQLLERTPTPTSGTSWRLDWKHAEEAK